jgi:putative ABC transport system permease protein
MGIWTRIRSFGRLPRAQRERDLEREIRSHLDLEAEESGQCGARRAFGNVTLVKEDVRAAWGWTRMEQFARDVRYGLRQVRRNPVFSALTIATLALGIGATSGIFSVVHGVLIRPLPYPESERLISLTHRYDNSSQKKLPASTAIYFTYRDNNRSFESVALWTMDTATVTGDGSPEEVRSLETTFEFLPMLRVNPVSGRLFVPWDDQPGTPRTVILAHGYWQRKFGGTDVVGRNLTVDGVPHEVIGVLPPSFRFLRQDADILLPMQPNRAISFVGPLGENGIARLRPNVTIEEASADIDRMIPILTSTFLPPRGMAQNQPLQPAVQFLKEAIVGDLRNVLSVLMGTIALLLVVACANVANLQLVRTESRSTELAVQAALGAPRSRIVLGLLAENTLLALIGGAFGLVLATAALRAFLQMSAGQLPAAVEIEIGLPVMLFALAVSILSGLLFGFVSAIRHTRPEIVQGLGSSRSLNVNRGSQRIRSALVVAQVALALVLLVASGLMIRTFQSLRNVDAGFDANADIQTVDITIPQGAMPDYKLAVRKFNDIQDRLAAIAGVDSVGFASRVPLGDTGPSSVFFGENKTPGGVASPQAEFRYVSPDFFRTMGTRLVAGRDFSWTDHHELRRVAMVSEGMARREWGAASAAIGKRIRMTQAEPWREIVGVVSDVHHESLVEPAPDSVYLTLGEPLARFMGRTVTFVIRSGRVGTPGFLEDLQKGVWSVDGTLPLANVQTMTDYYLRALERTTLTLLLLGVTAGMALLLGLVGIYGVISYVVSLRVREIGIRLALGAPITTLRRMLIGRVLVLVFLGITVGLAGAATLARLMQSLVFGVTPHDPLTYVVVSAILGFTAIAAGYLPARRITRIDPTVALRTE